MSARTALTLACSLACALASATSAAMNVSVDCSTSAGSLTSFWRSCGYSPAQAALRLDGLENTARIGALPRRAISQVRIHFLLDLVIITGFLPSKSEPSGYQLLYDWSLLDFLLDTLVAHDLSPGFELFGSPSGFPTLPQAFWTGWSNNFKVSATQALQMFRTLVRDVVVRYATRFGGPEVSTWNFELWNEPDSGWGWGNDALLNATIASAYILHWDAAAAGVADAEAATGLRLVLGGPGAGRYPGASNLLPLVFAHLETGRNAWTGAPPRLDFLSIHYKGRNTSYLVSELALEGFSWMRRPGSGAGPVSQALPFSNDEGDPLVSWMIPLEWRGDARYGAVVPKVVNQHLLRIADNRTGNNPLHTTALSNDNGFMNADGYNGFGQRTLLARFADPPTGRFAFVRKPGLHAMAMLSKLGDARVAYAGAPGPAAVAHAATGVIATASAADGVAVLVYNSNDTESAGATAVVRLSLASTPFRAGANVTLVHYRLDAGHGNAFAVWAAQGAPDVPSAEQLRALWAADRLAPLAPPARVFPDAAGALVLPPFDLPLPGVSLLHLAAQPPGGAPPPPPARVRPYAKPPALSLLDPAAASEVLVVWDCTASPRTILGHVVHVSAAGAGGPWVDAGAPSDDFTCAFVHGAAPPGAGTALWYRVAAVDYWGAVSDWSAVAQAVPWPAIP